MLKIENIEKSFSNGDEVVQALAGVSLNVEENEFVAFMGSSGSGKSTLMNILGCLDSPSAGQYFLNNQNVADMSDQDLSQVRNQHMALFFKPFTYYLSSMP